MLIRAHRRRALAVVTVAAAAAIGLIAANATDATSSAAKVIPNRSGLTASPIKHLVVIFDENISYDHYFGTYPKAANTDGTKFYAVGAARPKANNLVTLAPAHQQPEPVQPDAG